MFRLSQSFVTQVEVRHLCPPFAGQKGVIMTKAVIEEIKAAHSAPADDYIVWAEVESQGEAVDVVLHMVHLPQSIGPDAILSRMETQAKTTLAENGLTPNEVAGAKLHITPLPSAEETQAMIDAATTIHSELALVDLVGWEAVKARFHLKPYLVENGDMEMDLKGLKIRRSAAA